MTLHFIHIGKTGGTAVKRGLRQRKLAYWASDDPQKAFETPYGRIELHHHRFRLCDVPRGDHAFFCLRDPIDRFLSAFYSRLNKGQPRYYFEWTPAERRAFEAFPTPQRLAGALAGDDVTERTVAEQAMRDIRHMRPMVRSVGTPTQLRSRSSQLVYVARQETLATDWEHLKVLLRLPPDATLPSANVRAHRRGPSLDAELDAAATAAVRKWYRRDYLLLRYCDALRTWNGWGAGPPPEGMERLQHGLTRMQGLRAFVPFRLWIRRGLGEK